MKKITTFALIILSLFSVVLFSACGDKYKKLKMEILYTSGDTVEELVLIKDSNDSKKSTERIGVKFSGIDEGDIGQVAVYSVPGELFTTSNANYNGNYYYVDINATKPSTGELIVKHLATGRTVSTKLRIEQKSEDLVKRSERYVVAVNGLSEGQTRIHTLNAKNLVSLVPSSSTDKIYFKVEDDINLPANVDIRTEQIDGQDYVKEFEISYNAGLPTGSIKLIPVTKMYGYEDKEYTDKIVTINFEKVLSNENVVVDTDINHKYEYAVGDLRIYDTIHLIANENAPNKDNTYNFNNAIFDIKTLDLGEISEYLDDYSIAINEYSADMSNTSAIQSNHIGNGKFVVQALAYTDDVVEVEFVLVPKNLVGDVETISKTIKVKGDLRANEIVAKKTNEIIDVNHVVDIYDYVHGNTNGHKFNFQTSTKGEEESSINLFNDLTLMRIEIAPQILYLNKNEATNKYDNIIDMDGSLIDFTTTQLGDAVNGYVDLANQKKLIRIFKGNSYLNFKYDSVNKVFISEPFRSVDNLYIKYVENEDGGTGVALSLKVISGYEGNLNYLTDIPQAEIILDFEAQKGVKSLELFASKFSPAVGGGTDNSYIGGNDNPTVVTDGIYINKSSDEIVWNGDVNTHGYTISILKDKSIFDANNQPLNTDVRFKVEIINVSNLIKPIELLEVEEGLDVNLNETNISKHIPIVANKNTSVGHYIITFTSGNDFVKSVNVYIYKEFNVNEMTLNFGEGELDQYSFKNSYMYDNETPDDKSDDLKKYTFKDYTADYIIEAGKTLNLSVNIDEDIINSNIIADYMYSIEDNGLVMNNYFNFIKNSDNASKSQLNFINGTYDGDKYYISYQIRIKTRNFTVLQEDKENPKISEPVVLTFFIYEKIADGKDIKAKLIHPNHQLYIEDYLGYYNKHLSVADLSVQMADENLWNYVQKQEIEDGVFELIDWKIENYIQNSGGGNKIAINPGADFFNKQEKSISVQFKKAESYISYNSIITAEIKQFNTVIPLTWSVLVYRPYLTEELRLVNVEPRFNQIKNNIIEYDLDLQEGDEFEIYAEHFRAGGEVTHKGISIIPVSGAGNTMYGVISVERNKIKVNRIQAGVKLIVFASDVLKEDVTLYSSGFNNPENFIKESVPTGDQYKKAYFIINLHLEDGKTRETAYSVYDSKDFANMMNETEGKWYRIMNDINLKGMSSTAFNKNFKGHIFGYDEGCNIYGLELNNINKNLFKTFTGTIENICFETSYNYNSSTTSGNLGIIGMLDSTATLQYVRVIATGTSELTTGSYNFGLLVGENKGNIFYYENINNGKYEGRKCTAISGEITLKGGASVIFGGIAGVNNANVIAENYNESDLSKGATQNITFATSEGQEGVLVNINIDATKFTSSNSYFGGIVGRHCGILTNAYVIGTINAPNVDNVGGAIGCAVFNKPDNNSYIWNTNSQRLTTESDIVNVEHVKSAVIISANDNVGGIVGVDTYGVYKHCWYQILPTTNMGIFANEKVGGIVGYSTNSKLQFCSVFSYKYDYADGTKYIASLKNVDDSEKNADIIGNNYVAGLIGFVENSNVTLTITGQTEYDVAQLAVVKNSSVNAIIESKYNVGAIYATNDNEASGIVYSVYFIGKLSGTIRELTNSALYDGILCLDNLGSSVSNFVYTLNVKDDNFVTGKTKDFDITSNADYWCNYTGINLNYIYVSSDKTENKPIFDLVPSSFNVVTTDDTTKINKYFYDFSVGEVNETELNNLNKEFNQHNLLDLFKFTYAPGGSIAVAVKSSNTNVVDIVFDGSTAKLKVVGTGSAVLTFYPVLNPNLVSIIEVQVEETLSNVIVTQDGRTALTEVNVTKDVTKQVQHYSVGNKIADNNNTYFYKATNQYGLILEIKWTDLGKSGSYYVADPIISNYINISGAQILENSQNSLTCFKVYIPYGTMLSFTGEKVGGIFDVSVIPCDINGGEIEDAISSIFVLNTCTGASGISLNYNSAIVYPNDVTTLVATIKTDIALDVDAIWKLLYSINLDGETLDIYNADGSLNMDEVNKYFVLKDGYDNFDGKKQIVTFIVKIDEKFAENKTASTLKFNFKTEYTGFETAEYSILPQRIDKIEAKSYSYTNFAEGKITQSEVLKPNNLGLLVIDIAPINGYFDYLEIDDITGNEEIVFMQLDCVNGESIFERDYPSNLGKGIRLVKVDKNNDGIVDSSSIYVTMQIDANYTSKLHTIQITAYYQNGTVGELLRPADYKYIDVKMLPIIKVEHQLPNGETKLYETKSSDTPTPENLFFANGTSSQFRITTLNTTEPLRYNVTVGGAVLDNFEFVNVHNDFYILRNLRKDDDDYGKTIQIQLIAESIIGPNLETTTLTLEFKIVKYVIHSVSVTSTNNKGEIFGNIGVPAELEFYFKATDISYYENGTYHDKIYTYESGLSGVDETRNSINEILEELNTNADKYLILNTGFNSDYNSPEIANNKNGKYIELTAEDKEKIVLTTNSDGENKLVVYSGYNEKAYLAVDMELKLKDDFNWSVQQNIESTTIELSKNYKLNFIKPYSEDDYMLVKNEEDFLAMQSGKQNYYILGNDLVLENYSPIDIDIAEFDGNGRTIIIKSFAKFTEENIQAGLFKQIYSGMTVKNVNVVYQSTSYETVYSFGRALIKNSNSNVKDFNVDYADICNDSTINYVSATFGGLTPTNNGVVTNCTVDGEIALRASTVELNKTATEGGNYEIAFNIGGLVGTNSETGYITHSSSELKIFALANVGGLVYENAGKIASSAVEDDALIYSYNINLEKTILVEVGGFVSHNSGSISMSHATYNFSYNESEKNTGGFMSCKDESAGFVYENSGEIKNCYTEMLKIGDNNHTFCGFVYDNAFGEIKNCYTNINQGKDPGTSTHMFAQNGTSNLEYCLEFVNVVTGYVPNSSVGLKTIDYNETNNSEQRIKQIYEENGFIFGSNNQAVWSINGVKLPVLVACEDKVRYTENKSSTNKNYYGLRNFEYVEKTIKNPDGTTSFEYKVEFREDSYGTKENPFVIYNLANWENRFYNNSTMYYRIVADIEFDVLKNPTTSVMTFSGNIQGNDMTLINIKLYLQEDVEALGLFKTLQTADNFRIESSVKNLNLEIVSGWASKADAFGVLAGKAIGYKIYNISVNAPDVVLVGGNAVGGVAGYVAGEFDIDGISTNIGVNSTRELSTYRYNIYAGKNNSLESNLNKVFYAGSAFGVVDGYDGRYFDINTVRDVEKDKYVINHIKVQGDSVLIGDTVGGAFGFVGEKVLAKNIDVNLAGAEFKGYQYSAGVAGENRGVITNAKVVLINESFVEANYAIGGAVGLNIGGLITNVYVEADIIRNSNISVGGILARNINGVITDVEFNGVVFGNIVGGFMAANYSSDIFNKNTGAGGLIDTENVELIVPSSEVSYGTGIINYNNLTLSERTLDYFIENIHKFYSYREVTKTVGDTTETEMMQYKYRAFGLFAGMTDIETSKINNVYYVEDGSVILNGMSNSVIEKEIEIVPDNTVEKIKFVQDNDNSYALNTDGSFSEKGVKATENVRTITKTTIKSADKDVTLEHLTPIYITGVNVKHFDSWDKSSFTDDFVVFGVFELPDEE